jgi:hypothetical protein
MIIFELSSIILINDKDLIKLLSNHLYRIPLCKLSFDFIEILIKFVL